jgi:hypothetical protein
VLDQLEDGLRSRIGDPARHYLDALDRAPAQVAEWFRKCKAADYPE